MNVPFLFLLFICLFLLLTPFHFALAIEKVTCEHIGCTDGDFLVHTMRDCSMKAGLKEYSGDLRRSTTITPERWAKGVAQHIENGCLHREVQMSRVHCVELPFSVCNCSNLQLLEIRDFAGRHKTCNIDQMSDNLLLAITNMPVRIHWNGAAQFKPPETSPVKFCIDESTLESRQSYCERQEMGIVSKLIRGQPNSLETYFKAKSKSAVALISCLRVGLDRFSQCSDSAVSAYLNTLYEIDIAPGVEVDHRLLNSSFIAKANEYDKRQVVGAITTRHLLLSDQTLPSLCQITEVNLLLLSNDYIDVTAVTERLTESPKIKAFFISFYRPETPRSPILTLHIDWQKMRKHYSIDESVASNYGKWQLLFIFQFKLIVLNFPTVEITDTWDVENVVAIDEKQASMWLKIEGTRPDYLNILISIPETILEHSVGNLVSGCDKQSLSIANEIDRLKPKFSQYMIDNCKVFCRHCVEWEADCFYDCLHHNDTQAAVNVANLYKSYSKLFQGPPFEKEMDKTVTTMGAVYDHAIDTGFRAVGEDFDNHHWESTGEFVEDRTRSGGQTPSHQQHELISESAQPQPTFILSSVFTTLLFVYLILSLF